MDQCNYKFAQFSNWVNVFKPGTGTVRVYENTGGSRGALLYTKMGVPLTPGPLVVVIKVAASQTGNMSGYWPPSLPDSIETIAASCESPKLCMEEVRIFSPCTCTCIRWSVGCRVCADNVDFLNMLFGLLDDADVQGANSSKVRLFNLSPDTKSASMGIALGPAPVSIAKDVAFGLGSTWTPVPPVAGKFSFTDGGSNKVLVSATEIPPPAPLGFTNMLIGLQSSSGAMGVKAVPLVDAPEGGTCHP